MAVYKITSSQHYFFSRKSNIIRKILLNRDVSTRKGYKKLRPFYSKIKKENFLKEIFQNVLYRVVLYVDGIKRKIIRFFASKKQIVRFFKYCAAFGIGILACVVHASSSSGYIEPKLPAPIMHVLETNTHGYSRNNSNDYSRNNSNDYSRNNSNDYSKETILIEEQPIFSIRPNQKSGIIKSHTNLYYPTKSVITDYSTELKNTQSSRFDSLKRNLSWYAGCDVSSQYHSVSNYLPASNTPVNELKIGTKTQNSMAQRLKEVDRRTQSVLKTKFTPYLGLELNTTENDLIKNVPNSQSYIKALYVPRYETGRLSYNLSVSNIVRTIDKLEFEMSYEFKKYGDSLRPTRSEPLMSQNLAINYFPSNGPGYLSVQLGRADILTRNRCLVTKDKQPSFSVSWRYSPRVTKKPKILPKLKGGMQENPNNWQIQPYNPGNWQAQLSNLPQEIN